MLIILESFGETCRILEYLNLTRNMHLLILCPFFLIYVLVLSVMEVDEGKVLKKICLLLFCAVRITLCLYT